ncbi:BMP-binding endothelial regulator protein-like [Glandiceps talaboti]
MTTFDGHRYNFQGLCWYTLVKVCNSDLHKFDISTLFEPRPYDGIELKTRPVTVIVSVDDESVILNKDNTYFVRKSLGNGEFMASKATKMNITTEVDKIIVKLHDIKLTVTWIAGDHMVFTDLADPRYYGHVCGLLGDADGNPENDFTKPDGSITKEIMDFGESWKVDKLTCPEYEYL